MSTRPINFVFNFVPADAGHGAWTYAYNLPKAGESHAAGGTYTIGQPNKDGSLSLSMTGKDHVVFKGFDGNMPIGYGFNLVPAPDIVCPGAK